ncbi:MAG TPA: hypothetical protein PLG67_01225 [Bacillota bacterium]|nr:hypothetical protein [Bacillota bacterium]HRS20351.1 hypothetical protein [Clostridia bacterium]HQE65212.1 hypothetical protein [Bacillota bacterium]HQI15391.1 hypothetical protein [Bacillota bacterium]HQJ36454.1 hypothetical protein [Bacillota bacterium]
MKRKSGTMPARAISIITTFLILTSSMLFPVPVFASYAVTDISAKKLGLNEIIEYTYNENFEQLTPHEQWLMKTAFLQVEAKLSKDPEGYLSMAYMAMVTAGANPKAQAVMAAWGAQKYPQSPCLLNNLGYALSILKEYDNAETVYKRVLELDEKRLETIINLGNLYMDADRDEEAKASYDSALKLDKDCSKAWEGLWGYYMKKKDYASALEIAGKVPQPGGFVQKGTKELADKVEEENKAPKLESIKTDDSLDTMERKLEGIYQSKPLTLVTVIEKLDPEMARKVKEATENIKAGIKAPQKPWPYEYNNLRDYYITTQAYGSASSFFMSDESSKIVMPQPPQISEEEVKKAAKDYVNELQKSVGQMQNIDLTDMNKVMEMAKSINKAIEGASSGQMPGVGDVQQPGKSISDITAELGAGDKKGTVTTSNYNNYFIHKANFQKYIGQSIDEYKKEVEKIKQEFNREMTALRKTQNDQLEQLDAEKLGENNPFEVMHISQRNSVREIYLSKFNSYSENFYRKHVLPAIEKMQDTQALYIKNMSNKNLRERESQEMKATINSYLNFFAKTQAPIDGYEIPVNAKDSAEAHKQLQDQIEKVKAQAPKAGEPLPQLKKFEDEQKSLLQKLYEDTKFESSIGLVKLTYENAELTLGLNDPINQEYMDLGVNLKEFSVSLTEGKGSEVSFKLAEGVKGTSLEGIEAEIGWSVRQPGRKTTIFFDDNFKAVDAQITNTPGSESFSAGVGAGSTSLEGSIKIETNAEGTSQFVSQIKASVYDVTILEEQYKENLAP